MNHVTRSISTALLFAASVSAFANIQNSAVQRIEISAPREAAAAAQAVLSLRDLDTTYEMSSGRNLVVSSFGEVLRVRYGRRAATTLHFDGQGSFVSHDGSLVLQFELDKRGEPQLVRLSMPATWL